MNPADEALLDRHAEALGLATTPGPGVHRAYVQIVHREVMGVPVVVQVRPKRPVEQLQDWGHLAGLGRRQRRVIVRRQS